MPKQLPLSRSISTTDDFRQHCGFVALMLISGACTVYMMIVLRSILRPFLWALFLVMGLTPAVALVERFLLCTAWRLWQCGAFLLRCVCRACRWVCGMCGRGSGNGACRRKSARSAPRSPPASRAGTITGSLGKSSSIELAEVVAPSVLGSMSTAEERRSWTAAATPNQPITKDGSDSGGNERESLESDYSAPEVRSASPCSRRMTHAVAIAIVVAAVIGSIAACVLLVVDSIVNLQRHWDVYKRGAKNMGESAQRIMIHVTGSMPHELADELATNALGRAEEFLSALVTEILSNAGRSIGEFLMMALYIAFWLSDPMPIGNNIEELFKRYIILKGLACLGYGICVGVLLSVLGVDLATAFGLFAFLLSFVPEVGAIVAMLLPSPVILFDSRLESPMVTLAVAMFAQMGLKFLFANIVEVKLVEADQLMKMHPVIILLAVALFGFIWGPTGMLLSVPLVAYLKVALLSDQVPPRYRDPILVVLEGDRSAPAKYARGQPESDGDESDGADDACGGATRSACTPRDNGTAMRAAED